MKIVIVTMHVDRVIANGCLAAGADGFVPKDAGAAELLDAIDTVLAGRRYLSRRVPKSSTRVGLAAQRLGLAELTPRQHEILLLLGEGKLPNEVAKTLGLVPSTITFHTRNMMRKLGVTSEGTLLRLAVLFTAALADPENREPERTHTE